MRAYAIHPAYQDIAVPGDPCGTALLPSIAILPLRNIAAILPTIIFLTVLWRTSHSLWPLCTSLW